MPFDFDNVRKQNPKEGPAHKRAGLLSEELRILREEK